jgi:hypothetical protein
MTAELLTDWAPIRIHWETGQPQVEWAYLEQGRFTHPFFDDTVEAALRRPFSLLFRRQTTLDALADLQVRTPGLPPTGFIFHMSRCGSTLAAQVLAGLPQNIVISEAGPIDAVLRANWRDPQITDEQRIAWLRGLLGVYARPHHGEQHFFVKFDSWHTLELPLIRRAFPHVPWVFLYRDPVQVLVSHSRQRGAQMVHGLLPPAWLGLDWVSLGNRSPDEYTARVLARICQAAVDHRDEQALFLNYRRLPVSLWTELATHFGVVYTPAEINCMQEKAGFDAKNPGQTFVNDQATKTQSATPTMRLLADQWLASVFAAMESR